MAKKKRKKRRTTTQKIVIVLGILIALSMILSLFVGLGSGGGDNSQAPLPDGMDELDERLYPVRSQPDPPASSLTDESSSGEPAG